MQPPAIITIDGPAGTGKSTVGERLAQHLGYTYFDTGIMYRTVTLAALRRELDCHDGPAIEHLAHQMTIDVQPPTQDDGRQYTILLEGHDITWEIRTPAVDQNVSVVSKHAGVRQELIRQQRLIGQRGRIVMVGRDIGTIVMPDAPVKIYLQTSLEERARRRFREQQARGGNQSLADVQADMARRDTLDAHVIAPAHDAHIIHTDTRSPEESVAMILQVFGTAYNGRRN